MDAASAVVTVPASSATASATTTPTSSNAINVNQSNNHIHTNPNTHSGANSSNSSSNISIGGNSSNSNSSCSSSSTSSNSSGYGSTTTTPTNNYDLQQQTTPTTTPIPTTPVAIAEPIIPVATVAAVTPYYNESITTHNLETHQLQHHPHHTQQQQLQQHQHQLLQPNHHLQFPQNHLQANLQPQQPHHHQYLSRQQYYSTYDYQQPAPTHNLSGSSALTAAAAAYNVGVTGPYELSSPSYGSGQYKSSSLSGAINYERAGIRTNATATSYNHQQQQQQQQSEQQQSKTINQQTQQFPAVLASSKQRSSSLIGNSTSTNTSKPQAAATPFYAQPLSSQSHSNPTPFYDNTKYKMPLEYHDSYGNPSAAAAASYHQQQKYYAAAKSQLKEAAYGASAGLNSKSVYPNTTNFFPGPAANHGLPATSYDKYMYPHASATGYSSTGHMGNETPPEVSSYRKPVAANSMNSPSWPWGIDYASGNSRTIPPPASHLPTATVAPTHATYLQPNPTALTRDPYYMAHDKYAVKYDKYAAPSYQQSYVSPPSSRHHLWPSTAHASNLTQLNERHLLASGPTAPPSHGLHTTPYFPNSSTAGLNSRQSCCSQPYQPQSCYYPSSHAIPPRLPHNQSNSGAAPSSGYLPSQQTLGQAPHLNALTASCKYGGVIPDYGNGNKIKNSNDLYLNAHHYDNNTSPHTYGYGSAHSSQQLYASNAHQSMAHGLTPSSLLTHDPLNANQASYTNDLSLTTSNFDNYHTHLEPHLSPQTLAGIHGQQPPPAYGPTVAKRALLDYRKPIQPQPPPTIAEECYTTLSSRDHYNQQELLNTPETTTTFAEYEAHQNNASSLSSYSHTPEALADADKANDEGNKNLSLRDFIANWNDDEDEYQNNEELNFDQATVIDEVLQTAPVEQAVAAAAVENSEMIKTSSLDSKNTEHSLLKSHKIVENLDAQTLSDQYVNLPDIVIDIEKSNNVNNSITTPSTSPTPNTQQEANNFPSNLNNFDVEKELDELKLKKPTQQELTKDLNDINDTKSVTTPQLSPCKNLTTQLSFEDLNLEPANKTVLNATTPTTTRLTNQQSSELTENYFKDMEGYESGSSHHSNESAFEKEYETFINKITSDASTNKNSEEKSAEADFEQNVQDFSKFYKRKRKLKEDELKTSVPETQGHKKLKTNVATKVYNSNFPQVYTKKSRNRLNKAKQQSPHKRKPLSVYYKVIHSIRRFGLHRLKRVREYMTELKDKHLPLIKRQSIKNYTHGLPDNLFNAKSLKVLCIIAINTEEFRQRLMLSIEDREICLQTEEKHICTDPTCETCEVIKSLMEAESFEDTLLQQVCENNTEIPDISSAILCEEGKTETITIVDNVEIISFNKEEPTMISNEIENVQYSKENLTEFDNSNFTTKAEHLVSPNQININKSETEFDLNNWYEKSKSPELDLQTKEYSEIPLQQDSATENCNMETSPTQQEKEAKYDLETEISNGDFNQVNKTEAADAKLVSQTILCDDENSNISTASKNIKEPESHTSAEFHESSNTTLKTEKIEAQKFSQTKNQESESEESDSSESDSDSSSSSSDDESVDDSKDSHKKSDSNDKSSDTDSESDLENDNDKVNSDSNQSYHSVNNKREQNTASKVDKESVKPSDLSKSENMEEGSDSKYNEINEPKEVSLKFNPVNMNRDVNTDSDTEDEIIPKSPQHIVIRIKKSIKLSPNKNSSREVYVSENSLKSYAKFDNQSETESEDDDISEKECELISTTLKLSPKKKNSLDDHVTAKSVSSQSELENQTESESEDDDIIKKKVKLSPKQEELATEKLMEPDTELDNHRETESEDDEISEKKFKFSPKQEALATVQLMEPHTELNKHIESESEEGEDIFENESKIVSTSLQLSPKPEDSLEDHETENPIESSTELDNHTESESEDGDNEEKESEIVSASLELSRKQEDSIESLATNTPIEPQTEVDNHTERESENDEILEKESEMSTKKEDSIEDHVTEKPIEPHTESDNHTESESDDDDISEKEIFSNPLKLSTNKEDSIEDHATENPIEPHIESENHTESESEDDDISEKNCEMISTPLNLSPKNKDSIKDDVSEKSFELQSESEDDQISEKEFKVITTSLKLTPKQDNSIEENAEQTESDSEDDEIFQRNSEINTTSPKLSPIQNDNAEFDDQIEQESEDKKDKETELISTSLKFTPKQGVFIDQPTSSKSELESHTENTTKCDALFVDLEKETDVLTTTSDLSPTPQNSIEECTPEKSADLSYEAEVLTQTKEVFATEKSAESFTEFDKHTESKSEDYTVEDISKDKSNFLELRQKADDVKTDEFSKNSTQECIEVDDHIESQSEYDTDDEEDLLLKLSQVQSKDSDHTIILSDSDSSSYSESETDNEDVAMKSIKKSNDSIPIMISDDESMDNSFDNEDSQKSTNISEDSLHEIKSDVDLTESNDSEKSLIDGDNIDLFMNSQEKIINEDSNFSSNKLELKQVNDPEIPEPARTTEKTMPTNEDISPVNDPEIPEIARTTEESMPTNDDTSPDSKIMEDHEVSNNVIESSYEFSSNINSPKQDLPLDCVEINQTHAIYDENTCEKCISEYSSSTEDLDEEIDDKLSTKDDQGTEEQLPSEPLLQDIEDQSSIPSENNYNYSECEKNTDVGLESNIPDAVLEINLSKNNQNSPKIPVCESEKSIPSIYSPDENELLQNSEELNEDSNTLEEKSRIPKNFSEQTNQKVAVIALYETVLEETCENLEILADVTVKNFTTEAENIPDNLENALSETIPEETPEILTDITVKNFTAEAAKISNNLENEDQNKIKEDSSIINATIPEESNSKGCADHEEHFDSEETIAQTANTDESNIREDVNSPTSESSKETPDPEESQEHFEREETIAKIANTDDSNIREDVNSPTSETSKETPAPEESQTNSKAITEELIVLDQISSETEELNADPETITEESNLAKTHNNTSATFDEISCENPSTDDPPTEDCENISETKTSESETDKIDNGTIVESITEKSKTADLSVDINNEPLETLKEIYYEKVTNTEFVTETSEIIIQAVTEESEYLEKVNSEEISEEACNPKDITSGNTNEESEYLAKAITEESNNRPSPDSLKISVKIISDIGTEVLDIIPQEISKDSDILVNNQSLEISENTTEHCTNLDEHVINKSETLEKSCDDEVIVWKEALQTVEHMSARKEVVSPVTISEPKPESSELAEEPNTQSSEVFEEDCEQATESLDNLEDTDIFKEDLGSSQETFDEKESNNESLIKDSATVSVADVSEIQEQKKDHTTSEPKPETLELAEEPNTQSSEVSEVDCEQANESLDNVEDTDIFKEVMQEDLGNSQETFDEKESNKESLTKDSAADPVNDASKILEHEQDHTTPEPKPEILELAEEPNTQSSEAFEEECEQATESLDNLEGLGSSQETFDEKESNNESLTKDSVTVSVEQEDDPMINNKAIIQHAESLEETINKSSESGATICDQIESTIKGFETSCEEVIEKPNTLMEDENENSECIEKESIPMNERLSESEALVEEPNTFIEDKHEVSGPVNQFQSKSEDLVKETNKAIEDKYVTTECCKEDSGAVHECVSKSEEEEENKQESSEFYVEESDPSRECLSKSEAVVEKPNSLLEDNIETSACYKEDPSISKLETVIAKPSASIADNNDTFESCEVETETYSKDEELMALKSQTDTKALAENLKLSFKEQVLDSVSPEENESIDGNEQESGTTLPKDNELVSEKYPADEPLSAVQQTGDLEPSLNESLTENVSNKDSNTQEDLSGDFLGFKNQSSFEDESEDFHGFEDLEEVARIRQEIENINDDSTANDGFLNYANLNRDLHKSSTTSLTGSTSSEINELEALEKEISQHQTEMEEDEDKETDNELQTQNDKIVSTNDIEHIKQMLESDEEQQQDELDQGGDEERPQQIMADADNIKDKFVENSKKKSNDILSSVNSIIPKLSDLCRAALNSSLNSNSNLAQHTETPTILVERELSVEEALAEMYRQAGVLLSDPEDCDNDIATDGGVEEAHDVLLINLQEILNSDNNEVYVLQCDMNENMLNVVQQTAADRRQDQQDSDVVDDTERVNTVQFIGILDTQSTEPQIHIISSDSESEVIILSDDESDFGYRPFIARQERITIPFINDNDINDSDSLSDISTIHHEEIVPDNLNKFLQEEFYKYLHEKYVQRNISKYYHANRVLKKYRKRFVKTKRQ